MAVSYRFDTPDRFVVGAIGDADLRSYCLQVREGNRLLTLACEAQQIEALAAHLARVLDEVSHVSRGAVEVPPPARSVDDTAPLDLPLDEDFAVGTMAIGWDTTASALHVELFSEAGGRPTAPDPELTGEQLAAREAERAREMVTITLSPQAGRAFVARANAILDVDLPSCPLCLQPIEPDGHICPRLNGYRGPDAWQPKPDDLPDAR